MFSLSRKNIDRDQKIQKKGIQLNIPALDRKPKGLTKADININTVKKYNGYIFFTNKALNPCKYEPKTQDNRIKKGPT